MSRFHIINMAVMGLMAAVVLNGAITGIQAASPWAVRSITVYEASRAIGNLAEPAPFSDMNVIVSNQEANLELIAQIMPRDGERILVVTELEKRIITALTSRGVVGRSLPGGYEIQDTEQEAILRLNGVFPQGSRKAVVAIIISETPEGVQLLALVTASVKPPPGMIVLAGKVLWPWGLIAAVAVGLGALLLFRRPRRRTLWEE